MVRDRAAEKRPRTNGGAAEAAYWCARLAFGHSTNGDVPVRGRLRLQVPRMILCPQALRGPHLSGSIRAEDGVTGRAAGGS